MLRFVILSILVAVGSEAVSIRPLAEPSLGTSIQGAASECGSRGEILGIRVTGCTIVPCELKVGSSVTVEADFKSAQSHSSLLISLILTKEGKSIPYVTESVPFPIEQGQLYTVSLPLVVTGKFGTGPMSIKLQAGDDGFTELCGIADAIILD